MYRFQSELDSQGDGSSGAPDASSNGRFCADHATRTFCEDFDDTGMLKPEWSQTTNKGGALGVGPPAKSLPNALGLYVPVGDAPRVAVAREFFGHFKRVSCEFDFYFEKVDGKDSQDGPILEVGNEAAGVVKYVSLATNLVYAEDADRVESRYSSSPEHLAWTHYVFVADFEKQEARVSHDNGPTSWVTFAKYPLSEKIVLSFGISYPRLGAVGYRIDNIVCDLVE